MSSKTNIVIVNTLPFPSGAASENRFFLFERDLNEIGNNVTVIQLHVVRYIGT
jgi:hypothetical protein